MNRKNPRLFFPAEGDAPSGGAGTTPPAASAAPAAADTQNSTPAWTQSIADDALRQYAEGKGFKDVGEAAKAMQEMETRFAVPADAADYALPVPEGDDGAFAKQAAAWMKDSGVPVQAARQLAQKWNEFQASQAQAQQVAQQQAGERAIAELRGEWGGQFDANVALGQKAMRAFGVPAEVVEKLAGAMGDAQTIKVFQSIGSSLSESTLNPGAPGNSNSQPSRIEDRMYRNTK